MKCDGLKGYIFSIASLLQERAQIPRAGDAAMFTVHITLHIYHVTRTSTLPSIG